MAQQETDWWSEYWRTHNYTSPAASKILAPENWSGYQVTFGKLIEQMFGRYEDQSGGLMASEGRAIENEVARLQSLREKPKRTKLTDHYACGQITMAQILYGSGTSAPEQISKFMADTSKLKKLRWQQEVCLEVYSPTGMHAGFFHRKFDLETDDSIFEIKTHLPKDTERILVDFAVMSICWPVLKHGLVETIASPWYKLKALRQGEHNSFSRIAPNVKPTYAIVAADGIITSEEMGFNIQTAKEYQEKVYRKLLLMLKVGQ